MIIKTLLVLTLVIRKISGACTTNTLGLTGNGLSATSFVCNIDDANYHSACGIGDFDTVFTNSDPANCPLTYCNVRVECTDVSTPSSEFTIGTSP